MYRTLNNFYGDKLPTRACTSLANNNGKFIDYRREIPYVSKETFELQAPPTRTLINELTENKSCTTPFPPSVIEKDLFVNFEEADNLLPVLDCRFNLREICKQCILLEDHLTHKEKRCKDCCIKHFLALEGLCEEAITLDKEGTMLNELNSLPQDIRDIQKKWYRDPTRNAHECSQQLRELRKKFQQQTFDVIFNNSCSSGVCHL